MLTIALANHKGGVGKTTTAHTLGAGLAAYHGRKVLLVDLDPQSSLTGVCGLAGASPNMADVLGGASPGDKAISDILIKVDTNLYLAPADLDLAPAELGLTSRMNREFILRRALAGVAGSFDVVLMDCPPSLSLLTVNALGAANAVLIPTQPQGVDLRGLASFMQTLETVQAELTPGLEVLGILATFYDSRINSHNDAVEAMTAAGWPVLDIKIGRSTRVAEAGTVGETVLTFEPTNPRASEYISLAEVVNQWLERNENR